ncbi:MAG: hypothetical protein ACYDB7_02150 [Mycobacteriales bacterium]
MTTGLTIIVLAVVVTLLHGSGPYAFIAPPAGYALDRQDSGTLDLLAAEQATVADSSDTGRQLLADHFRGGQLRLWNGPGTFFEVGIFDFASSTGSQDFRSFETRYAVALTGGGPNATQAAEFAVPGVPAAVGFLANGDQSGGIAPLFIVGGWFTVGSRAYLVEEGTSYPQPPVVVTTAIQRQYALVKSS